MRDRLIILVADDEVAITDLVADILRDEGHDVQCVHDGASALQAIEAQTPDLVIMDNTMPVMSGAEALRTVRAQGFQQPIIIMSAFGQAQQFLRDGASAFLTKPFTIAALLHTVATHLGQL